MRILIVDDDIPTVEAIQSSIKWDLFEIDSIDTAYNIETAKKLIQAITPDVILCDIEMPKGSGIDLIKWVRENNYDSQFIFITCHQDFEYAATAIAYSAVGYVTKPFDIHKTEAAIAKAVDKIVQNRQLHTNSRYGTFWLESEVVVEESFWRDILFLTIPPRIDIINVEIANRHLNLDITDGYYIVLTCIGQSMIEESVWDDSTFKYAFRNLTNEVILEEPDYRHIFSYMKNGSFYNVNILNGNIKISDIKSRCAYLTEVCKIHLHCDVTCYISEHTVIDKIANVRENLEDMDINNVIFKGKILLEKDHLKYITNSQYALDADYFTQLFNEGKALEIVIKLQKELEILTLENKLDASILHSIHHDFMQIVYAVLYNRNIQAHKLFSDKSSQKLFQLSENSVFNMMKWATYITNKTLDYIKEVKQCGGVVEKIKMYIHENYNRNIVREDIASSVFLTSDYMSKLFKTETGYFIKDYINEYRIEKAKELLDSSNSSVSDIAVEVGFDNFTYFSTLFKKITATTPSAYRKRNEN